MPCRPAVRKILIAVFLFLSLRTTALAAPPAWLPFGPDGGDARRFAPDPHDHAHLYLGTANGWLYESHNSGANWKRIAQIAKRDDLVLDSIIVDPADARHLIVGAFSSVTSSDGGLFISYDGGLSWISQAEMRGQSIRAVTAAPSDPKTLVAGALRGVYRSTDGGQRWKLISPPDSTEIHEVQSVAIDPKDPNIIYAGTWHLPWKTTDAGEHWDNIKQGIIDDSDVFSIIIDPVAPKIVYASACSGIYKSEDAGDQFRKIQGIPSAARRTRVLHQDPAHLETVFAGTTEGLWRTDDAGAKWTRTTGSEIIVNDVFIDSADSRHVLIATDRGGILASEDGGDTFTPSNGGFSARQITAFKKDDTNPAHIFVGVVNDKEWGGVFESDNGGVAWSQRSNGLQGRDVFSLGQAPDGTIIAGTAHGLFRLDRDADAWTRVEAAPAGAPDAPAKVAPIAVRPPVPVQRNQYVKQTGLSTRVSKPVTSRGTSNLSAAGKARIAATSAHARSQTATAKRAHTLTAQKRTITRTTAHTAPVHKLASAPLRPVVVPSASTEARQADAAHSKFFDGSVYALATADKTMLALTSIGLLTSPDDGVTWQLGGPAGAADWRYLAAAKTNVVAGSMHSIQASTDSGGTWNDVQLPDGLTQIAAVSVDGAGELWGRRSGGCLLHH